MNRYMMKNGEFFFPPSEGVTADGRAVSNFGGRVRHDAAFAAENGYFPISEKKEEQDELLEGSTPKESVYILKNGEWVAE